MGHEEKITKDAVAQTTGAQAKDVMTANVHTVKVDWSFGQLIDFFATHKVSGAPVLNEKGEPVGVVTITDLLKREILSTKETVLNRASDFYGEFLGQELTSNDKEALIKVAEQTYQIKDIMTPVVYEVSEEDSLKAVATAMIERHIHRVFVTRNKQLCGIISSMDIVGQFAKS